MGELLSAPVVVRVTDAQGNPIEGATVEFELTSAGDGAEVEPSTRETDADGRAEAHVVLGDKVGLQTGEARVVTGTTTALKTSFTAIARTQDSDNSPPRADFNWHCEGLSCQFTDASTDDDGSVIDWAWQFGDGGASEQTEPVHVYAAPGTYEVTLTVVDDDGATNMSSTDVTVSAQSPPPESNESPEAEFEVDCQELTCSFTDRSEDDDGELVSWVWDFGDGTSSSERSPNHSYGTAGRYTVTLTVRDNDGAGDNKSRTVEPKGPEPNKAPQAEFEVHCAGLTCAFVDKSKDDDGAVAGWQWNFGDGESSSERNPVHTYDNAGKYEVLLIVTDDDGDIDAKTHDADAKD